MIVGHGLLAFAIVASVAAYYGWADDRALAIGVIAGLFATLPDVDVLYAVTGLVSAEISGTDSFWAVTNEVHRGITHSVVIGLVSAVGFAAWRGRTNRVVGAIGVVLLAVVVGVGLGSGPGVGAVAVAFVLGGIAIVELARYWSFGTLAVLATAGFGLVSHPFGDVFTGSMPAFLYPIGSLSLERVTLHADPTVHLLGTVLIEIGIVWAALLVAVTLGTETRVRESIRPRAALGVGYAAAALFVPSPTLDAAIPFVLSSLAVGTVAVPPRLDWPDPVVAMTTALTAITLAIVTYGSVYWVFLA